MMTAERTVTQETSLSLDRAHATAEELLVVLRAETEALRAFQKDYLVELLARKEALAGELAERMGALDSSQPSRDSDATGVSAEGDEEERRKRASLKALLGKIVKANHRNHVFVQGSLEHWQELLALLLPGTYAFSQAGEATRQSLPTKGLALNREI